MSGETLPSRADVVVVGGGISGLSTAFYLRQRLAPDAFIVVLESAARAGGKIWTRPVADLPVDVGPDAFLARSPGLKSLVNDLGLADLVTGPAASIAYVWSRGGLRRLPPGAMFGIPDRIVPMLRSGLLSPTGALRAGLDLVRPRTKPTSDDPSVGELLRPRFGREVFDRLVQPLLGGVHAGDADQLSAHSSVPEVATLASSGRSLILTLRARRKAAGSQSSPVLVSLRGGMGALVEALVTSLGHAVRTGVTVQDIKATREGLLLHTSDGVIVAGQLVLATPAHVSAQLLDTVNPIAASVLREIPYVDVANVTLAFTSSDIAGQIPDGTGFLVPPAEGELLVGSSWLSNKWPHLVGKDVVLIRSLVGRAGDRRWLSMSDLELVAAVRESLSRLMGVSAEPIDALVQRWPGAMPQYTVGHANRLTRLDAALAEDSRVHLTGAAYRGVGLAACVTQASEVARHIAERITTASAASTDLPGSFEGVLQ